jgi:small subunit ribosomal protein S6
MSLVAATELPPREYEVIYILRPDVSKESAERVAQRVTEVVARDGGTLTLIENWGRRPLAYEIDHSKRGLYVYFNFLGNGALVSELERNFRMIDEVVRYQTVKLTDEPEAEELDEELLKFEAEEPTEADSEELSLEDELGLSGNARPDFRSSRSSDEDSDDDDDEDDIPKLNQENSDAE